MNDWIAKVVLKKGREKSLVRHHPWIFSGAIQTQDQIPAQGATVVVESADGQFLAWGAYSPHSQIRVRVWSFDPAETINSDFFARRLKRALAMRQKMFDFDQISACRLVYSESDGLPGLIVDRYGDFLVCQFLSAGSERWKSVIIEHLRNLLPGAGIYERSDAEARKKEGLPLFTGVCAGNEPPALLEIRENNAKFLVDVRRGHKTGFYLDQRNNRAQAAEFARGARVLNCFSYTGGFGIPALLAGAAQVIQVDSSAGALELARQNLELNGLDAEKVEHFQSDVFTLLRKFRDEQRQFDLIILDPPKFVESAEQLLQGSRGYQDINRLALQLLRSGGILFTFSCSGHMERNLFQKIVADAALEAHQEVQIIRFLSQAEDHPVAANFPEAAYLKGLVCRIC